MNITKQKLLLMSIVIIMMILISNIFAFSTENYESVNGVSTSNVNFRKAANLNSSSVVQNIKKGTNFNVVGSIGNFYIVLLDTKKVGLISKDYVKIDDPTSTLDDLGYENIVKYFATVNGDTVNLRSGPSTSFSTYKKLYNKEKVEIIGRIENFYLIVTSDNYVGFLREDLINQTEDTSKYQEDVLNLINQRRKADGLDELKVDPNLEIVAKRKADDMVKQNYFSHTSPTYGSPFEMMKASGILYKSAGENIAGNPSIEDAVSSWIASDEHIKNILSKDFNYVGIGVTKSAVYGYIIVVMFIQK